MALRFLREIDKLSLPKKEEPFLLNMAPRPGIEPRIMP